VLRCVEASAWLWKPLRGCGGLPSRASAAVGASPPAHRRQHSYAWAHRNLMHLQATVLQHAAQLLILL
jgi:hypothetical protein